MEHQSVSLQYKVGIFVAVGLITMMLAILLLGGNRMAFRHLATFRVQFKEVQGLFPGSVVSLAGVPVGNVKRISFASGSTDLLLDLQVEEIAATRITAGTLAEIRTQGALGDKYIYLTPGSPDRTLLPEGSVIPTNEDGDIFSKLISKEDGIGKALDVIKEAHRLLATLNEGGHLSKTLSNFAVASGDMRAAMNAYTALAGQLRQQLPEDQKLKQAVASLASILEKIDHGKGTLGALINDPTLHQNLKSMLGGSARQSYVKDVVRESIQQSESKH